MTTTPKRILLVEDDDDIARLVEFRLRREGHTVARCAEGRSALVAIETQPPADLVVLDVMLPFADGFEVLKALRGHPPWSRVPVIMLTSMDRESDVEAGLRLGADDYLMKPFRPPELVARIARLLDR